MRWHHDLVIVLAAVTLVAALSPAAPAFADQHCDEDATVGPDSGEARATCETPTSASAVGSGPVCDPNSRDVAYYANPPEDLDSRHEQHWMRTITRNPAPDGSKYRGAFNCDGRYLGGPHLVDDPQWMDVSGLRESATARVTPVAPSPNVSPTEPVVRFVSWLWVDDADWQVASDTQSDGSLAVRVEARPRQVTWDLVEGVRVCDGPGIPWSPGAHDDYETQPVNVRGAGNPACTFEFVHSSTTQPDGVYRASVTVTWEFAWWVDGVDRGVFGTHDATSEFDLRVGEIQALITR